MAAGRSQCILPGTGHRLVLTSLVKHTDANTCYNTNAQKTKNKTSAALLHTCIQYKNVLFSMEQHRWAKMYSSVWSSTDGQKYTLLQKSCSIHTHSIGTPIVEFALYRYNYKIPLLNYYLLAQMMAQYCQVEDGKWQSLISVSMVPFN